MKFRTLKTEDAKEFSALIQNMYNNLENLEWFSPMPYDEENVRAMIENPRFFILGAFEGNELCAVSSFDFKCGKLIGQNCMPTYCTLDNTAEIGFTMVKSNFKGQGIMKRLIKELERCALTFGKQYLFGKVHIDNLASYKSFLSCGFSEFSRYSKSVQREDFEKFLPSKLLSPSTYKKAEETLKKNAADIVVCYAILIKKL